jgi:aspartyl-tRNA(Asn)/glutamyl-tRNA(Gln) amidotransferase subunit A
MEILGKSITQLKKLLSKKEVSPSELFEYFSKRSSKSNEGLNAYVTQTEYKENIHDGLLSGIPFAIKDNFCTEGVRTTASANVLKDFIPPYSATVVQKLHNAGAIMLGKTNMDAWAHGSSTETSDFGPSKNPYDTSRVPGGSSGGSAAAVSSYTAPFAIGSETAGSIRLPAAWCGVVGLKPTYGRVSRYGVIAMGSSLDCPGPFTTTVEDAALLLQVLSGNDPFDATSSTEKVEDYVSPLSEKKSMTIGVSDEYFDGVTDDVKAKTLDAIKVFEKMGHTIKKIKLISPKYAISVYTIIQRAEVSSNLSRYDGIRYGFDRSYFGKEAKRRMMFGTYTLSHGYYDAFYKKAQKVRTLIIEDFKNVFQNVDAIIAPTTPMTALKLGEWEKYPFFGEVMDVLNEPAAVAGLPAISIPAGVDANGMPVGIQIKANHFNEKTILQLAYQFERETNFFNLPRIWNNYG